jgi:serine/threonine protein kinase/Tfp pilus assembly protein PilF
MSLPTESQWARYSALCARLQPVPAAERAAVVQALRAEGHEDPRVLSLVALHWAIPPDPARDRTGDRLGDFTLEEPLGAGGMGVVYRAQQHIGATTRPVAVKLIHPTLLQTAREEALARFGAELRTLVTLQHAYIARIYDGGIYEDPYTHEQIPYLAMELVREGQALTAYCTAHALPVLERLTLVVQVCRALQYAHEHRMLHCDLKPANILVDSEGHPFVIDFGLARTYDELVPGASFVCAGTPAYMSPEQVADGFGALSVKTDVYALGLLLYEVLTGELPYHLPRDGSFDALRQVITTAVSRPLGAYDAAYRGELEALVAAALAKRPADRLPLAALRSRLERYLQQCVAPATEGAEAPQNMFLQVPYVKHSKVTENRSLSTQRRQMVRLSQPKTTLGCSSPTIAPQQHERTAIAVMPFRNISGDPEQDYFVEGLAEDIIAALSRFRWLLVSAHRATRAYTAQDTDARDIGRRLGVLYMLDGSVRKSALHLRVTVTLIKVESAEVIWAEQYNAPLDELFAMQAQITTTIVGHLDPKLRLAEIERTLRKPPERLDAHDCVLRAVFLINTLSRPALLEAHALLRTAIELNPNYATAYAWLAFCHMALFGQGWTQDVTATITEMDRCVRAALERDPDDDLALTIAGHCASFVQHDFERALRLFDKALQVNPNSAFAWARSAATYCYLGNPEEALQRLDRYRQLGPMACYVFLGDNVYCRAYTIAGRYPEAITWGRKVVHDYPDFSNGYKPLLASLGHAGYLEEARTYLHRLLQLEPDFSISAFRERYPFHKAADRERFIAGLRKAGVPETASTLGKVIRGYLNLSLSGLRRHGAQGRTTSTP